MITKAQKELVQWTMEYALENGCDAARLSLNKNSNTSFKIRDMKIDSLQQATKNELSIQLYFDERFGTISSNRLEKNELKRFIRNGIESISYTAKNKRDLPDASLYYKGGLPDLQLYDPKFAHIHPDEKVSLAMQVCNEMMDKNPHVVSSNSTYLDGDSFTYQITSNGFEGESSQSHYSLSANVSIKSGGDARPQSFWFESSLFFDELEKKNIGKKALERTLCRLGQRKIASAKMPMVVDFMVAANLLSPVIKAMMNHSFLSDKQDTKVFSDKMTLVDEPHLIKSYGARYFDNEGIATQKRNVFENGLLKMYFRNTFSAKTLKKPQTISSPSILTMPGGSKNAEQLTATLKKGILVTDFIGGNCNPGTGDFSYGIEGFLIENGKPTLPVCEMNITGNICTLWNNLVEVGNDARLSSSRRIPSLLFDQVDFSGI